MKLCLHACLSALLALYVMSCVSNYEAKGNDAYKASLNAQGLEKRKLEKEAYVYYQKAIQNNPQRVSPLLKSRYVEMTLKRAFLMLTEGSASMDALPLFMKDLSVYLNQDIDTKYKEQYAQFLSQLSDSSIAKGKFYQGMKYLDQAIEYAVNKSTYEQKRKGKLDSLAKYNYEAAEIALANGKANNDNKLYVQAEFLAQVALYHDPNYPNAKQILSEARKLNKATYSAYEAVVVDRPDTSVFHQVNKFDILLAVPKLSESGRSVYMEVMMFNYSWNPLRLRADGFYVVDSEGNKFPALKSSTFESEMLDQQKECKMRLSFNKGSKPIQKLVFDCPDLVVTDKNHYSEKVFF